MSEMAVWGGAHVVALLSLIAVIVAWSRTRSGIAWRAAAAGACALVVVAVLVALFRSTPVPTGWITILHEGRSMRNVQQLYGLTAHSGPGFYLVVDWLTRHDAATLPTVVALNVSLWAINIILFSFIADAVLGVWWASLAFAFVYACNLNTVHAALSETPAMLWSTYFWVGCVAAAVVADGGAPVAAWVRRLALLSLSLLAALAALLRAELLIIGAPAVAIAAVEVIGWEPAARRASGRAGEWVRSLLSGPLWRVAVAAGALLAVSWLPWPSQARWVVAALQPLDLSFLNLPRSLGVFLPLGVIALFVLGVVHGVRRWFAFCLLPISLLILFKLYGSAAHGAFFETFRYLTFVTPAVFFLAVFGFRELSEWADRWHWPWWWKRPAVALLALSFAVWRPPGAMKEMFGRGQRLPGLAPLPPAVATMSAPLLSWNQQTEVRYLLDLIARYPRCAFVVKAARADAALDGDRGYRWAVFGRSVAPYRELPDDGRSVQQVAAELAPDAPCVLFYRGLDCNLVDSDGCRAEIDSRTALEERVLENLPYSDIQEYGAHRAEIRLGVYPIVPPTT